MELLPVAFQALDQFKQFIVYVLSPSKTRTGKMDKYPVDYRSGQVANAHDSAIWLDANGAIAAAKQLGAGYGVGFVFTENDPFWFLDIDNCLSECGTKWNDVAMHLLTAFSGAAVEVSSSGKGLHIIGSGKPPKHSCKNSHYNLEFYTAARFIALTGLQASGNAGMDFTATVEWLVQNFFPANATPAQQDWTSTPCEQWNGSNDDVELIERALRSHSGKSAFGGGASFRDLWERNETVLSRAYPHSDKPFDESRADAALAQHLAFWTGNNCERIQRLMGQSGLRREKWDRVDYLPQTILGACGRQKEWLFDKPIQTSVLGKTVLDSLIRATKKENTTFLSIDQQIDVFAGCVYIMDEHKVLVPGGYVLNPERFRAMYGGYSMPMDTRNERVSRNAWEVLTESQAFDAPKVDSSCFKPEYKPGEIIVQDGQRMVNLWWPVNTPKVIGDPTPFLNHVRLLAPNEDDAMLLLCYMAASVQYQGFKFQWCPVIQGVEGNGKTFLTRCVAFAIGRRYTHFPKADQLTSKFNDYMYGHTFIGIEDIYVPDSRLEVMECMKPMVTNQFLEIEPKGGVKVTREICANFIINTNHKDGLRKHRSDRRFAPFYTAQQCVEDLKRDKMDSAYFSGLYGWAIKKEGFPITNHLLSTFEIPDDLNPAIGLQRAPHTTSTEEAIAQSVGSVEQELTEIIAQGLPGFRRGWISSFFFEKLLERLNATRRIPLNKRRDLLQSMGYDWHPGLKDGRCNNVVMPDNTKPRLYIRHDHQHRHLTGAAQIERAYEDDQK